MLISHTAEAFRKNGTMGQPLDCQFPAGRTSRTTSVIFGEATRPPPRRHRTRLWGLVTSVAPNHLCFNRFRDAAIYLYQNQIVQEALAVLINFAPEKLTGMALLVPMSYYFRPDASARTHQGSNMLIAVCALSKVSKGGSDLVGCGRRWLGGQPCGRAGGPPGRQQEAAAAVSSRAGGQHLPPRPLVFFKYRAASRNLWKIWFRWSPVGSSARRWARSNPNQGTLSLHNRLCRSI
jgi:hypothetical protein